MKKKFTPLLLTSLALNISLLFGGGILLTEKKDSVKRMESSYFQKENSSLFSKSSIHTLQMPSGKWKTSTSRSARDISREVSLTSQPVRLLNGLTLVSFAHENVGCVKNSLMSAPANSLYTF